MYVFLTKGGYTLVAGYPKRLEKEFGSPPGISLESVDAAFVCPGSSRLHVMAGERILSANGWLVLLPVWIQISIRTQDRVDQDI